MKIGKEKINRVQSKEKKRLSTAIKDITQTDGLAKRPNDLRPNNSSTEGAKTNVRFLNAHDGLTDTSM